MQDELSFTLFNESMNPVSLLTYGVTSKKKAGLHGLPIPWAQELCLHPCPAAMGQTNSLAPGSQGRTRVCGGDLSPEAL